MRRVGNPRRDAAVAAERERLDADHELNPLIGKPLRRRLRNFRAEADNYLASLGGPLPYMQRLREIEDDDRAARSSGSRRRTPSTARPGRLAPASPSAGTSARSTT